ncbi:MAG: Hsp70 family protein [Treponema sp.]|nr:Hsp70 family protein [Treponema sp.]
MAATIGIKIANGEFYSIVEENSTVKKRLILTTVHDKQRSVQIDLYKSFTRTMADALYIGSLVVENIKPRPKGEPSIELVISSNKEGEIIADAIDMDTSTKGEHQILSVSLKSLDEDNREYEIPDFELEQHEGPPTGLYERAEAIKKEKSNKFPTLIVILAGVFIILVLAVVWFLVLGGRESLSAAKNRTTVESTANEFAADKSASDKPAANNQPAAPAPQTQSPAVPPPAQTPAKPATQTPPPVIQAPPAQTAFSPAGQTVNRTRPPAPVSSYKVPAVIPANGAPYQIRWGDTLWDISEAFYRNPWLYPRIARFNNIRNPNLIISGTTIRIPPKN